MVNLIFCSSGIFFFLHSYSDNEKNYQELPVYTHTHTYVVVVVFTVILLRGYRKINNNTHSSQDSLDLGLHRKKNKQTKTTAKPKRHMFKKKKFFFSFNF